VHAPARIDPSAAPQNQDTLFVLVPVGHLHNHAKLGQQDWADMKRRAREAVLRRLESMGMADLEEHIKFEVAYTPRAWRSLYNLKVGSAFGLSHNFLQVGYMRPHNRHARYGNLYFVGSSTHPGTGLPMVLLSAKLTTERIMLEMSRPELTKRTSFVHLGHDRVDANVSGSGPVRYIGDPKIRNDDIGSGEIVLIGSK
jgi:phytoene dehydrogenase-like protein